MSVSENYTEKIGQFQQCLENAVFTDRAGRHLENEAGVDAGIAMLRDAGDAGQRVFVIGNGGSAAVAAHVVNDLVNCGHLRANTLHDASLLTCMANDYGYENAYANIVKAQMGEGDLLIAISSSGNSMNIRNAVDAALLANGRVMTLSGFKADNPLRGMGDLNIWLDSEHYGFAEIGHLFVLHHLLDRFKVERNP